MNPRILHVSIGMIVIGIAAGLALTQPKISAVHLNGIFEVVAATLLATGFYVRPVAGLLSLHLFGIAAQFGFTAVGIRDFGLAFATLSVALFGNDEYSS